MRVFTRMAMLFLALAIISFVSRAEAAVDRAKAAGLSPHKALYEIKMVSKKSGGQVVNVSGKMVYEWQPSCDAWITNNQYDLRYEYADTPAVSMDSDFSTYESFDGKSFNFTSQRKVNGALFEELRGMASIGASGKLSQASYSIPEDLVFNLPEGTVFPVTHTLDVLDKIREGKKFYVTTIFDGSDKEGPVEVNTFIGKPAEPEDWLKDNKEIDQSLVNTKAWNIRLAFFPLNKSESPSEYELDMVFHENGVITDMVVEYDSFSVRQKLLAIEPIADICQKSKD